MFNLSNIIIDRLRISMSDKYYS